MIVRATPVPTRAASPAPPSATTPAASLVERQDRAADVGGVKVRVPDVVQVDLPRDAHAERGDAAPIGVEAVDWSITM